MRFHRKVLLIFFVAFCTSAWLVVRWSTPKLWNQLTNKSQTSCKHVSVRKIVVVSRKNQTFSKPVRVSSEEPLYKRYKENTTRSVALRDDHNEYFKTTKEFRCLREGTANASDGCSCKKGWHGVSCNIPDVVDETRFPDPKQLRLRDGAPRRIIYGIPFNVEFEMLEIRLRDIGDLIDVLIVVESNFTGFGQRKKLLLLEELRRGFLHEYQHKILYLYLNFFPTNRNPKDGAYTDFFTKSYSSKFGLQYVTGTRNDDLFITADADELHRREALLFLKLHDGYPEPFGVILRRNVFGFFWCSGETLLGIGCSLEMLGEVYNNQSSEVRGATSSEHLYMKQLKEYEKRGHYVNMWQIGKNRSVSEIGGWHCSWCFDPPRVRVKLLSAYNYDFPRWGNYPEKTKLDYIRDLIKVGLWFDEKSRLKPQYPGLHHPYAPPYVLNNTDKYKNILFNPYRPM